MGKLLASAPYGSLIICAGALAALIALASLVQAIRVLRRGVTSSVHRRTARTLLVATSGALVVVPILTVWLTAGHRALFREALERATWGNSEPAGDLVRTLSDSLSTLPFGIFLVWPAVFFPAVAALVLLAKVLRMPDASRDNKPIRWWAYALASVAWTYAALLLPVATIARHSSALISALANAALHLEPDEKKAFMLSAISAANDRFIERIINVAIILVVPLIGSILLSLSADGDELRDGAQRAERWEPEWWIGGLCWLAAVVLFVVAAPLRAENADPVPDNPYMSFSFARTPFVQLPDLQGVDAVHYVPVVQLDEARLWLDGRAIADRQLAGDLDILNRAYRSQFPGREPPGELAVMCDMSTSIERLDQILGLARAASFVRFQLIVGRERTVERPLLGKLKRNNYAAIDFAFAADGADQGLGIAPVALHELAQPPRTCEALARVLIAQRGTAERVSIDL